jgi:uncharacterized protein YbjT (DUF2867 family)
MQSSPILVIGATGKTGSRVADLLDAAGHNVRRASRSSETPFDWEDTKTWAPALAGVSAVYITYYPDLAFPGVPEKFQVLTEMAAAAGVGRLVMLAGRGEPRAEACEDVVRNSGIDYTLVRAAWFAQNFSEGFLYDSVMEGMLALPAGTVGEPFVDLDDVAEVVVAALTDPRHAGQVYELTGPRLLTFDDAAAELSRSSGMSLTYQPITSEDFHAGLIDLAGPVMADVFTEVCRQIFDGRNAMLGDGVERALGRPARDFADYCTRAAAEGAWAKAA